MFLSSKWGSVTRSLEPVILLRDRRLQEVTVLKERLLEAGGYWGCCGGCSGYEVRIQIYQLNPGSSAEAQTVKSDRSLFSKRGFHRGKKFKNRFIFKLPLKKVTWLLDILKVNQKIYSCSTLYIPFSAIEMPIKHEKRFKVKEKFELR